MGYVAKLHQVYQYYDEDRRMHGTIAAILLMAGAVLAGASPARAQSCADAGGSCGTIVGYSAGMATGSQAIPGGYDFQFHGRFVGPSRYSYYATPPGLFPRTYVPYGSHDEFPFYGRPYGRPTDRWSWSAMSVW